MVALLTAVGRFEVALRTLGMALAGGQLPAFRTAHALISPWSRAGLARQVTLGALTPVTVVSVEEENHESRCASIFT